ncbi:unnamed protein product, partial [Timema podura]|nr:unnamed protein product [Timema podura]
CLRRYWSEQKQEWHERIMQRENIKYTAGMEVSYIKAKQCGEWRGRIPSSGDDRRVLIWDVEQAITGAGQPHAMNTQHISNIFCLGFDSTRKKVFSAGNDDQVIAHDIETGEAFDFFLHEQPVYGISMDPLNDNVFASACDDGRVLLYDIREPTNAEPFCLASYPSAFHAVMFNPVEPRILTTANSKEGVGLWDIRRPRKVIVHYGGANATQSCMSVRFNQQGTQILALRRRLPPVLYSTHSPSHLCQFDHPGYYNSCTMKSCCFAGGDDQYVLSGSDDFNLYVWKIPQGDNKGQWVSSAHMILRGHRSIVNQVRFNPSNYIIASSGVEKLIKFWSPFPLPESSGGLSMEEESIERMRKVFSHEEYISLVLRSGQFMSHDYSHQSTKEDPRMMAFFDSLVQREIEGWSSEDSVSSELSTSVFTEIVQEAARSSSSDSESVRTDTQETELQALAAAYVESLEDFTSRIGRVKYKGARGEEVGIGLVSSGEMRDVGGGDCFGFRLGPGFGVLTTAEYQAHSSINLELEPYRSAEAQNRISQLIAKKRTQLIRLARCRSQADDSDQPTPSTSRTRKTEHMTHISTDSSDSGRENKAISVEKPDDTNSNPSKKIQRSSKWRNLSNNNSAETAGASGSHTRNVETRNSGHESRKRRMKFMLACSESSDDEWWPANKRKLWWKKNKAKRDNSSDSDVATLPTESVGDSLLKVDSSSDSGTDTAKKKSLKRNTRILMKSDETDSESNNSTKDDSSLRKHNKVNIHEDSKTKGKKLSRRKRSNRSNNENALTSLNHKYVTEDKALTGSGEETDPISSSSAAFRNRNTNKVPTSTNKEALVALSATNGRSWCHENGNLNNAEDCLSSGSEEIIPTFSHASLMTPNGKQCNESLDTPDSGIVMAAGSSSGSRGSRESDSRPGSSSENHHVKENNSHSNGNGLRDSLDPSDWYVFSRYKERVNRICRNYRNRIGDSDSN